MSESRRFDRAIIAIAVAFALLIGALYAVLHGAIIDDGEYLYQGRRIFLGERPYRDFFIPQGPVILYTYGAVQALLGPDLYLGRFTSYALFLLLLLLTTLLARRRGGNPAAVLALVLLGTSLHALNGYTMIKTHTLTALILLLAAAALLRAESSPRWGLAAAFLGGLAVASRITSAIAAPWLLGHLWFRHRRKSGFVLRSLLCYILGVVVLFLPSLHGRLLEKLFYTLFWVQFERGSDPAAAGGIWNRVLFFSEAVSGYFLPLLLSALVVATAWRQRLFRRWRVEFALSGMALSVSLLYLIPSQISWLAYQLDVLPLYVLLLSVGLPPALTLRLGPTAAEKARRALLIALLLYPLTQARQAIVAPLLAARTSGELPLDHLYRLAERLEPLVGPEDEILAFEAYVPLLMDRRILPNLGSMMCYVPQWRSEPCRRFAVVNDQILVRWIQERRPRLILLTDADFQMLAAHQSYSHVNRLTPAQRAALPLLDEPLILASGYREIGQMSEYGQSRTTLHIYLRAGEDPAALPAPAAAAQANPPPPGDQRRPARRDPSPLSPGPPTE
jgi:hypothetical protein